MIWIRDFIHNCLVHPLLPFLPTEMGDRLHDVNAQWAFGETHPDPFKHRDAVEQALRGKSGIDITVHDLMHLAHSDSAGAELFRVMCDGWACDDPDRAGPEGPRIGTIYVEDLDGHLEIRLVTRLRSSVSQEPPLERVEAA